MCVCKYDGFAKQNDGTAACLNMIFQTIIFYN